MKIKICGIFREQDIEYVNEARPDYCGFVFAESKRHVSAAQATQLRQCLANGITTVGVFVNAPVEEITALYRDGVIDIAQLHGDEDEAYITQLKQANGSTHIPIIKVIKNLSQKNITQRHGGTKEDSAFQIFSQPFVPLCLCVNYYLFDSGSGSGETFDWQPLSALKIDKPWFLAGGINLANIKQAMALNPYAIDISSGAETDSVKDREKIVQLVTAVRKGIIS